MRISDSAINTLFVKLFLIGVLGYVLYTQTGSNGITIMTFTVMITQILNVRPEY